MIFTFPKAPWPTIACNLNFLSVTCQLLVTWLYNAIRTHFGKEWILPHGGLLSKGGGQLISDMAVISVSVLISGIGKLAPLSVE